MTKQQFRAKPVYILMLAFAAVFYVASVCVIQSDLYKRVCMLEHKLMHVQQNDDASCGRRN